jgi:hypothetical protein
VSSVVTIASDYDMSGSAAFSAYLGPESIRETWSHVRNSQAEFVLEPGRNSASGEVASHPIAWEVVCPNTVVGV